jgi:hypothetical protein
LFPSLGVAPLAAMATLEEVGEWFAVPFGSREWFCMIE